MSESSQSSAEVAGWKFTFAAGVAPLLAGILLFITGTLAVARESIRWPLGIASLDFSFADLAAVSDNAEPFVELISGVISVNVTVGALAVMFVSYYGLRLGQKLARWFLLMCFIVVGLNDAYVATQFTLATRIPMLIMPYTYCILMAIGLMRTRKAIFAAKPQ